MTLEPCEAQSALALNQCHGSRPDHFVPGWYERLCLPVLLPPLLLERTQVVGAL